MTTTKKPLPPMQNLVVVAEPELVVVGPEPPNGGSKIGVSNAAPSGGSRPRPLIGGSDTGIFIPRIATTTKPAPTTTMRPLVVVPPNAWIEIKAKGKYWGWRWGVGDKRKSKYGGKTSLLDNERMVEYERNKARRRANQQK